MIDRIGGDWNREIKPLIQLEFLFISANIRRKLTERPIRLLKVGTEAPRSDGTPHLLNPLAQSKLTGFVREASQ